MFNAKATAYDAAHNRLAEREDRNPDEGLAMVKALFNLQQDERAASRASVEVVVTSDR